MSYTALYRKFRPQTFDEVKGQDAIVTTLKNQLRAGRIGHAYLFCGTRGTGKTSVAKILARAVNCEHPTEAGPCNSCGTCRQVLNGTSTNVIEIDAASNNGVDNIREIRENVAYRPTTGKYKVYIIDEVHMLSTGAFNALLKTLEEPPEYVIFILATTEANKIPVTILSRCQRYDFRRIPIDTIAARIRELLDQENVTAEEKAVRYIARAADGSMRDALSLLDQCIAFYLGKELTFDRVLNVLGTVDTDVFSRLLRDIIAGDTVSCIRTLEELVQAGKEMSQFVSDFTWYMRNLLLVQSSEDLEDVLDVSKENLQQLREESKMISAETLMRFIRVFAELSGQIRYASQKRVLVETALIRLCRPEMDTDTVAQLQRIQNLEKQMENLQEMASSGAFAAGIAQGTGEVPPGGIPAGGGQPGGPSGVPAYGAVPGGNPYGTCAADRTPGRGAAGAGIPSGQASGYGQPSIQRAAPEELKEIRKNWMKIVGAAKQPLQSYLRSCTPMYDAGKDDSTLYLSCGNEICLGMLKEEKRENELKELFRKITGREVPFRVVQKNDRSAGNLQKLDIDAIIRKNIHMPVEEEDG